jgi:hypothetical protein
MNINFLGIMWYGRAGVGRPIVCQAAPSCHLSLAELIDGFSRWLPNYSCAAAPIKSTSAVLILGWQSMRSFGWGWGQAVDDWLEAAGTLVFTAVSRGWRAKSIACQKEFTCRQSLSVTRAFARFRINGWQFCYKKNSPIRQ